MGNPAARVGDVHSCPLSDGPKAHVGGPIAPPGGLTVIIGGSPAARVGDTAVCPGFPGNSIALGAPLVRSVGKHSARASDPTTHGGIILQGCPTVHIGLTPRGKSPCSFQAGAARIPSETERQEIQDALDASDNQRAIDLTKEYYEIDTSNVPNGVVFDPAETNYGIADIDGNVSLGTPAMGSPDTLASTIVHEVTHANQAQLLRTMNPSTSAWSSDPADVHYDELLAYEAELHSARNTGLSDDEIEIAAERYGEHYNESSNEARQSADSCIYPDP